MSIGERIVLAASLATTRHVLKTVEEQRDADAKSTDAAVASDNNSERDCVNA